MKSLLVAVVALCITSSTVNSVQVATEPILAMVRNEILREIENDEEPSPFAIAGNIVRSLGSVVEVIPGFLMGAAERVISDRSIVMDAQTLMGKVIAKIMEDEEGAGAAIEAVMALAMETGLMPDIIPDDLPQPMPEGPMLLQDSAEEN